MAKTIAVVMVDGVADWELGPVLSAARYYFGLEVTTASEDGGMLTSIGGLRIAPQRRVSDIQPLEAGLRLLPGSDDWGGKPIPPAVIAGLQAREAAGRASAAICSPANSPEHL